MYSEGMTDSDWREEVERARRLGTDDARVEIKASSRKLPKTVWETVSAFANGEGGLIILGLDEQKRFEAAPGFDAKRVRDEFLSGVDKRHGSVHAKVSPVPSCDVDIDEIDGASIVRIRVEPLNASLGEIGPCYVTAQGIGRGSYIRLGDADRHLTAYEVYTMQNSHRRDYTDREPVEATNVDSLDSASVRRTLDRVRSSRSNALAGVREDDVTEALTRLNVLDNEGRATLAGYLALGQYPQQRFPQLTIDVTAHPRSNKSASSAVRFLDRQVCDGPIPVAIRDAVHAVMRNLTTARTVNGVRGEDVPEIPEEVVREAITNAVTHRDYSAFVLGQQVSVDIYPDRIDISNPGGFWGDRSKENVGEGRSDSRNAALSRLLTDVPLPDSSDTVGENQGSGVPRMINAMRESGLPEPDYSASTTARVTVSLARHVRESEELRQCEGLPLKGVKGEVFRALDLRDARSIRELEDMTGRPAASLRPALRTLVDEGLVKATAPPQSRNRKYLRLND